MNIANKITMLRIFLIPIFLLILFLDIQNSNMIATIIFTFAALTDILDGYLARKYKLITNFGKFMDPMADKLLVISALIYLVQIGELHSLVVIIIISRELIISSFRLIASDNKIVIAASPYGKIKTIIQMILIIYLISGIHHIYNLNIITEILIYSSVISSLISLFDYVYKNKEVLK